MGARAGKLNEIIQRLKKFVTEDVRKNRILGLYLVIGVMVLGYGIYFLVVMYKDITSGPEKINPRFKSFIVNGFSPPSSITKIGP